MKIGYSSNSGCNSGSSSTAIMALVCSWRTTIIKFFNDILVGKEVYDEQMPTNETKWIGKHFLND
jgi:hypothetical protein